MATPMRSTDFRSIVEPILNEAFDGIYDLRQDEWKPIFTVKPGIERNYHEEPVLYGLGAAPELPDGMPITYQSGGVLFVKRYTYAVYGLAYALTRVLVEDGDHIRLGKIFSQYLAQALTETKETLTANILNYAFTSTVTGGDSVCLNSASHPISVGTFSNVLTTAANLSQTSLEQMLIQIRGTAVGNNGLKMTLNPMRLVISPSNIFNAEVLLNSALRPGVANNDINAVKSLGLLKEGITTITRLTSSTAWWIHTDAQNGLQMLTRRKLEKAMEGDFETDSMRYKATERYGLGWTDPRCMYGTPGV